MAEWLEIPPPSERLPCYARVIAWMGVSDARELSEELGWAPSIVYADMRVLVKSGVVHRVDSWPIVWELPTRAT